MLPLFRSLAIRESIQLSRGAASTSALGVPAALHCSTGAYGSPPVVGSATVGDPASALLNEYAVFPEPGVINGVSATTADAVPL